MSWLNAFSNWGKGIARDAGYLRDAVRPWSTRLWNSAKVAPWDTFRSYGKTLAMSHRTWGALGGAVGGAILAGNNSRYMGAIGGAMIGGAIGGNYGSYKEAYLNSRNLSRLSPPGAMNTLNKSIRTMGAMLSTRPLASAVVAGGLATLGIARATHDSFSYQRRFRNRPINGTARAVIPKRNFNGRYAKLRSNRGF